MRMTENEFRAAHSDETHKAWERDHLKEGLPPASATYVIDLRLCDDEELCTLYQAHCRVCKARMALKE